MRLTGRMFCRPCEKAVGDEVATLAADADNLRRLKRRSMFWGGYRYREMRAVSALGRNDSGRARSRLDSAG